MSNSLSKESEPNQGNGPENANAMDNLSCSSHSTICVLMFDSRGTLIWSTPAIGIALDLLGGKFPPRNVAELEDWFEDVRDERRVSGAFDKISKDRCEPLSGEALLRFVRREEVCLRWSWERIPVPDGGEKLFALSLWELDHESEANYGDSFDHAIEGLFRTTVGGRYLRANASLAKMYGYGSPQELIDALHDLNVQLYVQPGRRMEFVRLMREQGFVADFQSEVRRADGVVIWIVEFARTVLDADGNPWFFEGSVIEISAQKAAEQALRDSEERFRWLAETTNAVPWEAGFTFERFDYVGPQAVGLLGFPIEHWTRAGFWKERAHPDDAEWVKIVRDEAISNGRAFELEYRMLHADGRAIWIREIIGFSKAGGSKARLGGFLLNVTHRREAEDSLRESRLLIGQIASASPIILYAFDIMERRCVFVDGRVQDILGYEKTAIAAVDPFFLLNQDYVDELSSCEDHLAKLRGAGDGEVITREIQIRKKDGRLVWLCTREMVFTRSVAGDPRQIVGTAEDITEQIEAIHALIANEELFRRLVETTKVIPFEMDVSSGCFTYVGPQAENLLGYRLSDWRRDGFWNGLIHPLDRGWPLSERNADVQGERDFQYDFRVRAADGSYLWFRQILHCGKERDLRSVARGFLIDVTESKKLEEEGEETKRQLRALAERNQSIREEERISIARELHDELGQALTIFKIDLAWLSTRLLGMPSAVDTYPLTEKIRSMEKIADSTLGTVRRITSELRPPVLDELGLADAIEWQASEFGKRIGLRFDFKLQPVEPLPPKLATVAFRIFQEILTNVARHANATSVRIGLRRDEQQLSLTVSDNGSGIREEDQRKAASFGLLGMRERATAVGGTVDIRGVAGNGTTIIVKIPLKRAIPPFQIGS